MSAQLAETRSSFKCNNNITHRLWKQIQRPLGTVSQRPPVSIISTTREDFSMPRSNKAQKLGQLGTEKTGYMWTLRKHLTHKEHGGNNEETECLEVLGRQVIHHLPYSSK